MHVCVKGNTLPYFLIVSWNCILLLSLGGLSHKIYSIQQVCKVKLYKSPYFHTFFKKFEWFWQLPISFNIKSTIVVQQSHHSRSSMVKLDNYEIRWMASDFQ